ncbi:unnamed protein product [Allacma fusca]|uniref:Uncharacterized protein n=1 Tax=Allacma fusca TaxID=39272 RepID=A0A8J2J7J1_9HEXA|nr:unnamed protein product [Allacma fusca]
MENSINGGVDKSTAIQPGPRRYPEIKGEILERKEVTVRLISQMGRKLRNDPTLDFLQEEAVRAARFYGCSPPLTYQAQLYRVKTEFWDNLIPTESVLDKYRKEFLDTYLELASGNVHKGLPIQLYNLRRISGIFTEYAPGTLMNDLEGLRGYRLPEWDRFRALYRELTLRPDGLPPQFCISCGPLENCVTAEDACKKRKAVMKERGRESQVILDALEFFVGKEAHWEPMKTQNEVTPTGSEVDLCPSSSSNSMDSVKEDGEPEAWIFRGEAMSIHRENQWAQCAICLLKTPTLASLVEHMKSHAESESD